MTRVCTCPGSLASSLESSVKRNQLAEPSCKSCGGRFLVDGVGPLSRSMLGTVGLEVTNSINCELSWKTVKGKRSRKSVARNNGRVALGNKSPNRVGDFTGSDSDKFGEAGVGQCFPDKAEYVPIKKRRHYLRSPSPSSRTSLYSGRSVSPQLHSPSPHSDDLEHLSDHNGSSGSYTNRRGFVAAQVGNAGNDRALSDKVSEVTGGELYNSDNFSGIALLAAAACINNIDDDPYESKGDAVEISSLPQRSEASTSSLPVSECIPCSELGKQTDKDASLLDKELGKQMDKDASLVVESPCGAPCSSEENEEGKSASSKIDRRHWDLNTLMDAWEQPDKDTSDHYKCDDTCIDGRPTEKLDREGCAIQRDCISNGNGSESCRPLDQIESVTQSSTAKMKENGSEEFCQSSLCSLNGQSMEPLKYSSADTKVSSHVLGSNGSFTDCPLSESCHSSEVSGGTLDIKSCLVSTMIPGIDSSRDASSLANTSEQNVALPNASDLEKLGVENDGQLRNTEDPEKKNELPDDRIALGQEKCIGTCKTLAAENLENISEENTHPSHKCEGLAISDISVEGHSTVMSDAKGQDGKVLVANLEQLPSNPAKDDDPHVRDGEGAGRSILQDSGKGPVLDDCHNSDVSQDDPGCINGRDNVDDLEVGYDSPYEDGELRGSVLIYSWEENELEDGENECLDYESDGRVGEDSDIGDSPCSKVVEAGSEGSQGKETKGLLGLQVRETDSRRSTSVKSSSRGELKENREKIETAGKKVSNQGSGTTEELSTDVIVERNYGSRRCRISDRMDGLDVKGSYAAEVGSKTTRGKLQSRIEGPSQLDAVEKDNVYTLQSRSRNSGRSYSREARDGCPDRFVTRYRSAGQERERNGRNNQLVYWDSRSRYPSSYRGPEGQGPNRQRSSINDPADKFGGMNSHDHKQSMNYSSRTERDSSPDRFATRYRSAVHGRERIGGDGHLFYWESRNRYPSSYRGPEDQGQTRPRNVIADSVDKFGGLNPHDHKQSVNYSSKSMQRPLGWRRSPVDRDEYHGGQRRMAAFSSNRNRGGSRNFSEGVGRGPREEFHQPMDDDAASSVRMPHYLSWKGRGFFAPSTKVAHVSVPRRDSRSRSRTRSPRAWHPQRERNLGTRRHSRSPDFRSEARMDRMRASFQKPNFAADYGESFMSPPRGRFSPQRNFRGLDDRNFVDSHLRHRRSPLNVFRQSQRLESIGLSGRLKSDDSFRPMMRPGRFPPMAGLGRGCKLEENDDDKRHDDRSGMMH